MTKVFVGNFSFSVDNDKLKEYFTKVGNVVSAKVMTEGQGGRSRGFGFVEFSSGEEAQRAIEELNGSVWDGRVIKVSEDRGTRRDAQSANSEAGAHHQSSSSSGGSSSGGGSSEGRQQSAPMGYFRAQPLELSVRRRRKLDPFIENPELVIDYKHPRVLSRFMSERGRILPRRMTGLTSQNQRKVTRAIRRAQHLALLPITCAE